MASIFGMDMKQLALVMALTCAIVFGAGYKTAQFSEKRKAEPIVAVKTAEAPGPEKTRNVTVYITGAVKKPGVYSFPDGSRIVEALNKAEPAKEADLTSINLAEVMKDEMPIYVPRKGEADLTGSDGNATGSGSGTGTGSKSSTGRSSGKTRGAGTGARPGSLGISSLRAQPGNGKININTAGSGELDKLKGIGPALADRIIEYRNEHGKFNNISELKQVSGIGTKKFEELKEQVTI